MANVSPIGKADVVAKKQETAEDRYNDLLLDYVKEIRTDLKANSDKTDKALEASQSALQEVRVQNGRLAKTEKELQAIREKTEMKAVTLPGLSTKTIVGLIVVAIIFFFAIIITALGGKVPQVGL